jgi:hypothetical protein
MEGKFDMSDVEPPNGEPIDGESTEDGQSSKDLGDTEARRTSDDLRDKIKSKMEVAKFFSGFLAILLGLSFKDLKNLLERSSSENELVFSLVWFGVIFVLGSLTCSVATLFAYDRLLMPKAFWQGKAPNAHDTITWKRKNSSSKDSSSKMMNKYGAFGNFDKILHARMAAAWRYLFIPGVLFFFIGVIMLLMGLFWKNLEELTQWLTASLAIAFLIAVALPVVVYFRVRTPFDFGKFHATHKEYKWWTNLPSVYGRWDVKRNSPNEQGLSAQDDPKRGYYIEFFPSLPLPDQKADE